MDLRYLLLIFRSRWKVLAASILGFAIAGLVAGLWLPAKHQATAMLLVSAPHPDARVTSGGAPGNAATAVELLGSARVAKRVVALTGLSLEHPHARRWGRPAVAGADPADWLAAKLVKTTKFTTSADSSVIAIEAVSPDGAMAPRLANAFVQAYQEASRELQADQARLRLQQLEQGWPRIEADVAAARTSMAQFRAAHPNFNPEARSEGASAIAAALSGQLAQVEAERSAAQSAAADSTGFARDAQGDPQAASVQSLQAEARRARARLMAVSAQYGSNHPNYQAAVDEVNAAEQSLLSAARLAGRANAGKAASLRQALAEQERQSVGMASLQEEYSAFQRALVAAESAANAARDAMRRARLESESVIGGATVVAYAVPGATDPAHPLTKTLPAGAVLGLLLGAIGLLVAEESAPRWRTARSLMGTLGVRALAQVPSATGLKAPFARGEIRIPDLRPAPAQASVAEAGPARATRTSGHASERAAGEGLPAQRTPDGAAGGRVASRPERAGCESSSGFGLHRLQHSKDARTAFIVDVSPEHPVAEAIRAVRSQLLLDWRGSGRKRPLSIQSANPGDGKSFVATNLAIAFAQANLRTVLVDLNLRSPHLAALFCMDAPAGASTILAGENSRDALHAVDGAGRLSVLPAGPRPRNPQELISGEPLEAMLSSLEQRFDVVILDGPAWDTGADAQLIAAAATDVLLVARNDRTRLKDLEEMRDCYERLEVRVMGLVANEH